MNSVFLFAAYAMTHQGCGNLWQGNCLQRQCE
uniref:Uncharacterized protein n=2 Tax=Anguilla anguilla TaxID=7936 RepID=A0A0E9W0A1_ANGAN